MQLKLKKMFAAMPSWLTSVVNSKKSAWSSSIKYSNSFLNFHNFSCSVLAHPTVSTQSQFYFAACLSAISRGVPEKYPGLNSLREYRFFFLFSHFFPGNVSTGVSQSTIHPLNSTLLDCTGLCPDVTSRSDNSYSRLPITRTISFVHKHCNFTLSNLNPR